jgi:hypothetical protein
LDDVGVANLLENLDFPRDSLDIFLVMNFVLLEDFNGNLQFKMKLRSPIADMSTYLLASQRMLA